VKGGRLGDPEPFGEGMGIEDDPGVRWLLASDDPSIRYRTLTEVLGRSPHGRRVRAAARPVLQGPKMRALLAGQREDGGFGVHPYQKWTGAHWRLVSMVDLAIPKGEPRAVAAAETVLRWLGRAATSPHHAREVAGRIRRCASQEGNALGVCSRLGLTVDERVAGLADDLIRWQWPDGGWNCDLDPGARHSSFNETLRTAWGLGEYHASTGDGRALEAASRAVDLLLRHRLFRSERDGEVIDRTWLLLRYPAYWHYGVLAALGVVGLLNGLSDPRVDEALDLLERKRLPDGRWPVEGAYWKRVGGRETYSEVVDWGKRGPNEMVTLNALRVLRWAGRA
jgi:hypothetical protein